MDRTSDFIRQELTVNLFIKKEDAQVYFCKKVLFLKHHLPTLDKDEELIQEQKEGMWQIFLSGDWAYFHSQVIIKRVFLRIV